MLLSCFEFGAGDIPRLFLCIVITIFKKTLATFTNCLAIKIKAALAPQCVL